MGRKSSSKGTSPSAAAAPETSSRSPLLLGIVVVVLVGLGAYAFFGRSTEATPASAASSQPAQTTPAAAEATAEQVSAAAKRASYGPHKQATLPPIPFAGYEPPFGRDIATQAFVFAAEHPEVAAYVPCFCGCQAMGHTGNDDCFVKSRNANGDVTEWEPHGVECAVCIEVATRSRQMQASGAGATAIRNTVEREFTARYPNSPKMVVPKPPAAAASN